MCKNKQISEEQINKILSNVKTTLAIEGLEPSEFATNVSKMYLRGEINSEEAINKIIENILNEYKNKSIDK